MSNLEKIIAREEKLKKEQMKLRQQKKRELEKDELKLAKAVKQYFGFKNMSEFETYVTKNEVHTGVEISKEDYQFFKNVVGQMTQQNGNYRMGRDDLQPFMNELHKRVSEWKEIE